MGLVLDTGVTLALLDADDPAHERCVGLANTIGESLVIPAPTLVELEYWLRKRLPPFVWRAFTEDIAAGAYRLEHTTDEELLRTAELEVQYADLGLGFVDASVIALCERLGEPKVATLDRRHFTVVRPRHVSALRLLPD